MINAAEYLRPSSIAEAAAILGENRDEPFVFMAGGTDFIPLMKLGLKAPRRVASLSRIPELAKITVNDEYVSLGAAATLTEIAEHRGIAIAAPALRDAALAVASPQIRNRGTAGGNILQSRRCLYYNQSDYWRASIRRCFKTGGDICHQIPGSPVCRAFYYSDMAPALLALGSTVSVYNTSGEQKTLGLENFLDAYLTLDGKAGYSHALLTELRFPVPLFSCFVKFAMRRSFDFPLLSFSAVKSGEGWRVYAGGWGTRPVHLAAVEKALEDGNAQAAERIFLDEMKKRREVIREAGLSPKTRESLPLGALFGTGKNKRFFEVPLS